MPKVKATVSIGLCVRSTEFEVPDDSTDDEIDELVSDWANETISTRWNFVVEK